MGLPPNDFEEGLDDFEKRLKEGRKRATVQFILFIILLILVISVVFYGVVKIMPTVDDISRWLDSLHRIQNHLQ